jgi:hypothetical protein
MPLNYCKWQIYDFHDISLGSLDHMFYLFYSQYNCRLNLVLEWCPCWFWSYAPVGSGVMPLLTFAVIWTHSSFFLFCLILLSKKNRENCCLETRYYCKILALNTKKRNKRFHCLFYRVDLKFQQMHIKH